MRIILLIAILGILLISCENTNSINKEIKVNQEEINIDRLITIQNKNLNNNLYSFEIINIKKQNINCSIEILIEEGDKKQVIEEGIGLIEPGEVKEYQRMLNLPRGTSKISLETYCNLI
jgi:hypothetical protein